MSDAKPKPDEPTPNLSYEIHALAAATDEYADAYLKSRGMSYAHFRILSVLESQPGVTGKALAQCLQVSQASVSNSVRRMVELGYVVDTSREGMGNVQHLETTAAGRELFAKASEDLGGPLDAVCKEVGVEAHELAQILRRINAVAQKFPLPALPVV